MPGVKRKMVTQLDIARRLGLDVSSVNKILNRKPGPVFRRETIRKVYKVARDLGYDFGKLKFTHRRRSERREVAIGTELVIRTRDGSVHDQGVATIRDISLCGARVTDLAVPQGTIPAEPFTVLLRPLQRPLQEVELEGHVVRLLSAPPLTLGIDFTHVDPPTARKLQRLVTAST